MEPILLDIPMPIVTERLVIREPRVGEGAVVNAAVVETFAALHQWMPWAKELPTVEDTEKFTRESVAKFTLRQDFTLRLWDRAQARFIGCIGLHPQGWAPRVFEIGYWIRTSEAGKGLMSEAAIALADYAFNTFKADRVFIRCDERNVASARVAEKAGFQLEGILRNDSLDTAGGLRSTRLYARIK